MPAPTIEEQIEMVEHSLHSARAERYKMEKELDTLKKAQAYDEAILASLKKLRDLEKEEGR